MAGRAAWVATGYPPWAFLNGAASGEWHFTQSWTGLATSRSFSSDPCVRWQALHPSVVITLCGNFRLNGPGCGT